MKRTTIISLALLASLSIPLSASANQVSSDPATEPSNQPVGIAGTVTLLPLEKTKSYQDLRKYVNDLAKKNRASKAQKSRYSKRIEELYSVAKKDIGERAKIRRSNAWAKNRQGYRAAVRKAFEPYALEIKQITLQARGEIIEIKKDYRQEARDVRREEWGPRVNKVRRQVQAKIAQGKKRLSGKKLQNFKRRARQPLKAIIERRENYIQEEIWPSYRIEIAEVRVQRDIDIKDIEDDFNTGPRVDIAAEWREKFRKDDLPVLEKRLKGEEKSISDFRDRGKRIISRL